MNWLFLPWVARLLQRQPAEPGWSVTGSSETVQRFSRDRRDEVVARELARAMEASRDIHRSKSELKHLHRRIKSLQRALRRRRRRPQRRPRGNQGAPALAGGPQPGGALPAGQPAQHRGRLPFQPRRQRRGLDRGRRYRVLDAEYRHLD